MKEEEVDNSLGCLKLEEVLQVHEKEEIKVGANVLPNHTKCNANKGDRETLKTNQEGWKCGDQSHQKLSQFPTSKVLGTANRQIHEKGKLYIACNI